MSVEAQLFKKLLRKHNYSVTTQRRELFETLQKHQTVTLKELISLLSSMDEATIYRNIKIFEALGIVTYVRLGWHSKLELSDMFRHHHHHLSCLTCGKVVILKDNPVLEGEIERLSARRSFKPTDHQLEIRGYCSNCH